MTFVKHFNVSAHKPRQSFKLSNGTRGHKRRQEGQGRNHTACFESAGQPLTNLPARSFHPSRTPRTASRKT